MILRRRPLQPGPRRRPLIAWAGPLFAAAGLAVGTPSSPGQTSAPATQAAPGLIEPGLIEPVAPAAQPRWRTITLADGRAMDVAVITPGAIGPETPAVVLLPPGDQSKAMTDEALRRYIEASAIARGWIVVAPAAPGPSLVADPTPIIELLVQLPALLGGTRPASVHLAGVSTGGIAALAVAPVVRSRVASVVVLPGYAADDLTDAERRAIRGLPLTIIVGENDAPAWRDRARATAAAWAAAGAIVRVDPVAGQGHVLELGPTRLVDLLDAAQQRERARIAASAVLDDLHDAAAKADAPRYFGLFTPDAVFLGTDATERWPLPAFRAWAEQRQAFAPGRGWTYRPRDRAVFLNDALTTAWFDELLDHATLGECRGTGVLTRATPTDPWRIAQYHLTVPIPNARMEDVLRAIRGEPAPREPMPSR